MIRAESHRRFVFIIDYCKSNQLNQATDLAKLVLSITKVAIEDLRETFILLDNHVSETPILPMESNGSYLDLIMLNNINTLIPTINLPIKTLKSIPNAIYSQVMARKLVNIFCDLNKTNYIQDNLSHHEVMRQSIDCLTNLLDGTTDISCLKEIVAVLLEKTTNDPYSNIYVLFTIIFDSDNIIPVSVKCSLLKLINLVLYRCKIKCICYSNLSVEL